MADMTEEVVYNPFDPSFLAADPTGRSDEETGAYETRSVYETLRDSF
jgi:hypothetical protein